MFLCSASLIAKEVGPKYPQIVDVPPATNPAFPRGTDEITDAKPLHGLELVRWAKPSDYVSHIQDQYALLVSQRFYIIWAELNCSLSIEGAPCSVADSKGNIFNYQYRRVPKFELIEDVDPELTLFSWSRWNRGDGSHSHLPKFAEYYELLPAELQSIAEGPPPGWYSRQSIRAMALREDLRPEPPLFRVGYRLYCTDAFHDAYRAQMMTGLEFRKLEPSEAEWRGEIVRVEGRSQIW